MNNGIDDQIRELVQTIGRASPAPPALPVLDRPAVRLLGWRPVTAGLATFAVVGVVFVAILLSRPSPSVVLLGDVEVINEVSEYSVSFQCNVGELSESGGSNSMTIEVWADVDGGRFRAQATYPDGSVRNVIAIDHPLYPSQVLERGDPRGNQVECNGVPLAQDPTSGPVVVMLNNPPVDLPAGIEYHERASRQSGDHVDSLGRTADLFIEEVEAINVDVDTGAEWPIISTTRWYVDPIEGQVLEVVTKEVGVGVSDFLWEVTRTRTLASHEVVSVDDAVFDHEGYSILLDNSNVSNGTVEATEVDAISVLGNGWTSPYDFESESPELLGQRFASETLGWESATVEFAASDFVDAGEISVNSDGRTIKLLAVRQAGSWRLFQIHGSSNQGGIGVRIGVGAQPFATMFAVPSEAVTAEILVGTASGTRVWSTVLPPGTIEAALPGLAHDEITSVLILYLDAEATVVDVVGYVSPP